MSLWAVFLTGLLAGGASCAAVQGGLLAGVVARRRASEAAAVPASPSSPTAPAIGDDLAPVAGFLAGKLVSHALLGASLGALGAAVEIGFEARAALQIGAGLLMVLLAADLLGVPGLRRVVPQPPPSWGRLVRRSGRWGGAALGPGALGLSTILIPCGVTLSMEFLAVASGSPLSGAAVMAAFVLGTSPLFATLGYAARRSSAALGGRLAVLAGAAVLVVGLVSVNAGLTLRGSSFTLSSWWHSLRGDQPAPAVTAAGPLGPDGVQELVITVRPRSYTPPLLAARAGVPTRLVFRSNGATGCTSAVVFPSLHVERQLPVDGDTVIDVGRLRAGTHRYTCAMGMYSGTIEAQR